MQSYGKVAETFLHIFRANLPKKAFWAVYCLKSLGFAPKLFCTNRVKWA